jgi:ABC-type dipeptide/oligopeptide/nickel transport system permease component/ABC-type dipeptide/oligopeptide/nickel transport system permease subunit
MAIVIRNTVLLALAATLIIFLIVYTAPDIERLLVDPRMPSESRAALSAELGLDAPLPVQYIRWSINLVTLDWGNSFRARAPVSEIIGQRLLASLELLACALVVGAGLTAGLNLLSKTARARIESALAALPDFWLALLLILILGFSARVLPIGGRSDLRAGTDLPIFARLDYLVMPTLTLVVMGLGAYARWPNKLHPIAGFVYTASPVMVSSLVIVETVFSWPGLGRTITESAYSLDFPVLLYSVIVLTAFVVLIQASAQVGVQPAEIQSEVQRLQKALVRKPFDETVFTPVLVSIPTRSKHPLARLRAEVQTYTLHRDNPRGVWAVISLVVLAAVISPALAADSNRTNPAERLLPPFTSHYLLGTDALGRDVLSRLLAGTQTSLGIALAGGLIAAAGGTGVALTAKRLKRPQWGRGLADLLYILPAIPLLVLIVITRQYSPTVLVLAFGLFQVGAVIAHVIEQDAPLNHQFFLRLLAFSAAGVLLVESSLSFLGLGVQPPTPTWGNMLTDAQTYLRASPTLIVLPGLLIAMTAWCLHAVSRIPNR